MSKVIKKRSRKAGLPPGTLVHIGEKKTEIPRITIIDYDETHFQEREAKSIEAGSGPSSATCRAPGSVRALAGDGAGPFPSLGFKGVVEASRVLDRREDVQVEGGAQ